MKVEARAEKLVEQALYANATLTDAMLALRQLAYGANDLLTAMCRELSCESVADLKSQEPEVSAFVTNVETLVLGSADAAIQISKMIDECAVWKVRP